MSFLQLSALGPNECKIRRELRRDIHCVTGPEVEFARFMAHGNFTHKKNAAGCLSLMFIFEEGKNDVTRVKWN